MSKSIQERLKSLERQYKTLCCKVSDGGGSGGGIQSVTGLNTDNLDPLNPIVQIAVDGITITGNGTPSSPLVGNNSFELPYKAYRAKIATQTIDWPGYGYLYNWFAVNDARGLANPTGGTGLTAPNEWRVPSDTDWGTLELFAGGANVAGGKLKSTLTSTAYPFYGWLNNGGGTNYYNFNALPGGIRYNNGTFFFIGYSGFWWSSSEDNTTNSWYRFLNDGGDYFYRSNISKAYGLSVRLVREATAEELLLNNGDTSDTSSLDPYTGNNGTVYVTVKIGTQIWLAQNLRETLYNNTDPIFNASLLFGGDNSNVTWDAKGIAGEEAYTAYRYDNSFVPYDPEIGLNTTFYNEVLENTLGLPLDNFPIWAPSLNGNGPIYFLSAVVRNWNKTHIKITPGYDVNDFPIVNERSLLIQEAIEGTPYITFRPTKRDNTGTITIEDLNNYKNPFLGVTTSYVYVEILEYPPTTPTTPYYYYYGAGIGISNL